MTTTSSSSSRRRHQHKQRNLYVPLLLASNVLLMALLLVERHVAVSRITSTATATTTTAMCATKVSEVPLDRHTEVTASESESTVEIRTLSTHHAAAASVAVIPLLPENGLRDATGRLRLTRPTPPFEVVRQDPYFHRPAQTIHELVLQMTQTGRFTPQDIHEIMKMHRVAFVLTGTFWRAGGRPLDNHLIGTASLAVTLGQPLQVVLIMMAHSLAFFARGENAGEGNDAPPSRDDLKLLLQECPVQLLPETIETLLDWDDDKSLIVSPTKNNNNKRGKKNKKQHKPTNSTSQLLDKTILETINDLEELSSNYMVGWQLQQMPTAHRRQLLHQAQAHSLGHALEHFQLRLLQQFQLYEQEWLAVANNDMVPLHDGEGSYQAGIHLKELGGNNKKKSTDAMLPEQYGKFTVFAKLNYDNSTTSIIKPRRKLEYTTNTLMDASWKESCQRRRKRQLRVNNKENNSTHINDNMCNPIFAPAAATTAVKQ